MRSKALNQMPNPLLSLKRQLSVVGKRRRVGRSFSITYRYRMIVGTRMSNSLDVDASRRVSYEDQSRTDRQQYRSSLATPPTYLYSQIVRNSFAGCHCQLSDDDMISCNLIGCMSSVWMRRYVGSTCRLSDVDQMDKRP